MNPIVSFVLQFGLVLAPVVGFWVLNNRGLAAPWRLLTALGFAVATGAAAFALNAWLGWQPATRSGRVIEISAPVAFGVFGGGILIVLLLLGFWPKRAGR